MKVKRNFGAPHKTKPVDRWSFQKINNIRSLLIKRALSRNCPTGARWFDTLQAPTGRLAPRDLLTTSHGHISFSHASPGVPLSSPCHRARPHPRLRQVLRRQEDLRPSTTLIRALCEQYGPLYVDLPTWNVYTFARTRLTRAFRWLVLCIATFRPTTAPLGQLRVIKAMESTITHCMSPSPTQTTLL